MVRRRAARPLTCFRHRFTSLQQEPTTYILCLHSVNKSTIVYIIYLFTLDLENYKC